MYTAIKAGTTDTFMLWSPNVDINASPNYMVSSFPSCQWPSLTSACALHFYTGLLPWRGIRRHLRPLSVRPLLIEATRKAE